MDGPMCEIDRLPEACVSHGLSLTSPGDSCRAAAVSRMFRRAADSDTIWSGFLPADYRGILSRAVDTVSFSSSKELYFKLCDSVLIDGGRKVFSLERATGAKCITIGAKELGIVWGNDQRYWKWVSHPDSRFSEVAELRTVCWLEVSGSINSRELSFHKTYKAYLVFKIAEQARGLKVPPQAVSVRLGTQISVGEVCANPNEGDGQIPQGVQVPQARSDGWMEVEMGEFYTEDGSQGDVSVLFKHENPYWSYGLIIEGVQFRPR